MQACHIFMLGIQTSGYYFAPTCTNNVDSHYSGIDIHVAVVEVLLRQLLKLPWYTKLTKIQ